MAGEDLRVSQRAHRFAGLARPSSTTVAVPQTDAVTAVRTVADGRPGLVMRCAEAPRASGTARSGTVAPTGRARARAVYRPSSKEGILMPVVTSGSTHRTDACRDKSLRVGSGDPKPGPREVPQ